LSLLIFNPFGNDRLTMGFKNFAAIMPSVEADSLPHPILKITNIQANHEIDSLSKS
jgi:hypothetical protein